MAWRKKLCIVNVWLFTTVLLCCISLTKAVHSCNFDNGLCSGWSQSYQDDFDWTNQTGPTFSDGTGPISDHGGNGSYMYIETSYPRQYGDIAILDLSVSSSDIGKLSCLKFYYHMYGDAINILNVYNGNTTIFTRSGNYGNQWMVKEITLTLQSNVTFEGISGDSWSGDIAIDDVSIVEGMCQECTNMVNQSSERLDISYTSEFEPFCNWIVGDAGIPHAVAIVSIHQMNFSGYRGENVKGFDGNGTMAFAVHEWDPVFFNKSFRYIPFGESKNITIQVSLVNSQSYVILDYGILRQRLNLASLLVDWNVTVVNKTAKSIAIIWSHPTNLLSGGIRFYVAFARRINSSSESTGEIVAQNTTESEITYLSGYTEYNVGVVAVDGDGTPFKSNEVLVMTDEGVPSRAPSGVRVKNIEFTSDLLVEWNPLPQYYANGILLGYTIYYKENDILSTHKSVNSSIHNTTQFMLKDLKPAQEYLIAVAAFTSKGVGPMSDFVLSVTGFSTTLLNESFGQIEATAASNMDILYNWDIQSAGIREAVVFISVQELNLYSCSDQEFAKIINGNGTEVLYHFGCASFAPEILADVAFGLLSNISIQVKTRRRDSSIKMKFAIVKKGLKSALSILGWDATIFNLTSTSFTLQWRNLNETVANQSAKFYIVEVKSIQGTILTVDVVPGNATTTVIRRLSPSTKYRVGVFGVDSTGQSYKSLENVTTTKKVSCGFRPPMSRIVGGTIAPINSWPWQVMITDNSGNQFCGGSLVDPYWVVTAAHCLPGETASSIKIRVGAHYRTNGSVGTEQNIEVAKIIMHESYQNPLFDSNDIALLNLVNPAIVGEGVGFVCLPDTGHQLPLDNLNKKCWITGWGTLSFGGAAPNPLMQASVPLVSKQRCTSAYPGYIDDSMLCAGFDEGGIDACQGDSGGPLVCEFQGSWYLEGATSWGYGCAKAGYYGVYAKVRIFNSWLSSNMYRVVEPTVSPQNQSSSIVWCNFEHGLCSGWNQSSSDDFDWTLATGGTPSSSTGPTSGQGESGNYMYIEASSPTKPGENAKLVVTVPNNGNPSCLSFYYHMYGASVGTLNVYSGNTKVFSVSGNQGNNWLIVEKTIYLEGVATFEGITGRSYTGDIAIDSVQITNGSCTVSCSFDDGLCFGWSQSNLDFFDWTLNSGSTPSNGTGPSLDVSETGYYMYIETSSPQLAGDNAKLELSVSGNGEPSCLKFYYHMYGETMGSLTVFSGDMVVFNTSGNHGNRWKKAEITIYLNNTVTFEGIVGSSDTGDLAIDDVTFTNGSCQVHTATPTFSTPFTLMPSSASRVSTFEPSTIEPSLSSSASTFQSSTVKVSLSLGPSKTTPPSLSSSLPVTPRTPSLEEKQEAVLLEVQDLDITKWNKQMENDFKREVARVATDYCAADRTRCQLTPTSSRRKRSSGNTKFTSDMVHILPGYPKKSPDDPAKTLLAFYLQLPQGSSDNVVTKEALKAIVESDKSSIGGSIGGTISSVQSLPEEEDEKEEESDEESISLRTGIIIAACVGGVLLLVAIVAVVLACKRRKRSTDLQSAEKPTDNRNNNGAHFNNAYYMTSGDQARNDSHYSSPDIKPEEHVYETLSDPHAYTNKAAVESEMNSEGVARKST
ncbi:MAM and LDL-receptor class A domain-containing protein 1-like [Oculina patagonica]